MADIAADLQALAGFMQRVFLNAAGRTRPWGSMFSPLQLPKDWAEYERRIHANGLYYASNYLAIALLVAFVMIWSNWRLLFAYAVLIPVAAYCYGVRWSRGSLGGRSASSSKAGQERIGLAVGAAIWLWLTGCVLSSLLLVAVAFLTVTLHATLRPATMSGSLRARMASAADGVRAAFATPPAGSNVGSHDDDDGGDDFVVRSTGDAFRALLGVGKKRRGGSTSSGGGRAAGEGGAAAAALPSSGRGSGKKGSGSSAASASLEEAATPAPSDIEGSFPSASGFPSGGSFPSAPAAPGAWGAAPAAGPYDATSLHGHHMGGGVSPAGGEEFGSSAYAAPAPALHIRRGPQLPPSSGAPLPRPGNVRSD